MNDVSTLFSRLQTVRILDFLRLKPEARQVLRDTTKELCDIYYSASPLERADIVSYNRSEFSFVFLWFARMMAEEAVRKLSAEKLWDGLTALLIENYAMDGRETQIRLMLLFHSTIKLNLDAEKLFAKAASLAVNPDLEIAIRNFPRRPAESRSLGVFLYEECGSGELFNYRKLGT